MGASLIKSFETFFQKNEELAVSLPLSQIQPNFFYKQARCLVTGRGCVKNEEEAIRLFHFAADHGHLNARYWYGKMLAEGRGIVKQEALAVVQFRLAAEKGHVRAQYAYGVMLANGLGISQNKVLAAEQLLTAAERGYTPAIGYLKKMNNKSYQEKRDSFDRGVLAGFITTIGIATIIWAIAVFHTIKLEGASLAMSVGASLTLSGIRLFSLDAKYEWPMTMVKF